MLKITDKEWCEFKVLELFNYIRGNQNNMNSLIDGDDMLISAKNTNNGLKGFFSTNIQKKGKFKGHCITLNNDGDGGVGLAYYQPHDFLLDTHVYALYPKENLNRHTMLFIAQVLSKQRVCFSHGYSINQNRLKEMKIMLPVNENRLPDYSFMEQYITERERQLIQKYKNFIGKNIQSGGGVLTDLNSVKWKAFYINEIFSISAGKRLTKADMDNGKIPFIGATDSNNGITNWIATPNSSFDKNVLGVNYNGSVVENFYHPYGCIFSDDVKRLHLREHADNKYILLFFKTVILQQKVKYTYGYKFNGQRMERQKILLPVNEEGRPDYEFMEQYGKQIMLQKYQQYLNYICA